MLTEILKLLTLVNVVSKMLTIVNLYHNLLVNIRNISITKTDFYIFALQLKHKFYDSIQKGLRHRYC